MTEQEFTAMLDRAEYMSGWRPNTVLTFHGVFPIYTRRRTRGKQPRWIRVRIAASRLMDTRGDTTTSGIKSDITKD